MTLSVSVFVTVVLVVLVSAGTFLVGLVGLFRRLPGLGVMRRKDAAALIVLSLFAIVGVGMLAWGFDLGQTVTGTVTIDR